MPRVAAVAPRLNMMLNRNPEIPPVIIRGILRNTRTPKLTIPVVTSIMLRYSGRVDSILALESLGRRDSK
jgi:hypothetical protein